MGEPIRLLPARRPQAAETLAQAFRRDPLHDYICPDESRRLAAKRRLGEALIRHSFLYGEAWTAEDTSSVACWVAPGNAGCTLSRMLRTRFALPGAFFGMDSGERRRATSIFPRLGEVRQKVMPGPHW
jgi:hypothetical protein